MGIGQISKRKRKECGRNEGWKYRHKRYKGKKDNMKDIIVRLNPDHGLYQDIVVYLVHSAKH
jgi:hypothetical protein